MPVEDVERFGHEVALSRAGRPEELARAHVYLASSDSGFITGIILEVTGETLSSG